MGNRAFGCLVSSQIRNSTIEQLFCKEKNRNYCPENCHFFPVFAAKPLGPFHLSPCYNCNTCSEVTQRTEPIKVVVCRPESTGAPELFGRPCFPWPKSNTPLRHLLNFRHVSIPFEVQCILFCWTGVNELSTLQD